MAGLSAGFSSHGFKIRPKPGEGCRPNERRTAQLHVDVRACPQRPDSSGDPQQLGPRPGGEASTDVHVYGVPRYIEADDCSQMMVRGFRP